MTETASSTDFRHETSGSRDYAAVSTNLKLENSHIECISQGEGNENALVRGGGAYPNSGNPNAITWYETQAKEPEYEYKYQLQDDSAPVELEPAETDIAGGDVDFVRFVCDNCSREIELDQPRIHCNDCTGYDSCADCHLSGRMSGTHTFAHRFQIIQPERQPTREAMQYNDSQKEFVPPAVSVLRDATKSLRPVLPKSEVGVKTRATMRSDNSAPEPVQFASMDRKDQGPHWSITPSTSPVASSSPTPKRAWTWLGRSEGRKFSGQAVNLFTTIFDYVDNMYEPFGAGELSPEKFLHARCFWLDPKQKRELFSQAYKGEGSSGLANS
ncbi:hypothetical protein DRE_06787 [Drechslerella stenobrocha 248]|uniref:Uncharacterized protein n=1 Tax=Drechslerella stenobrocha 248 TaxID=1043628 RepID=W7HMT1_9PEZI|nr:hypothetical protein DRE_06787 [Drechslerella stenobrocha 248]